MPVAPWTWLGLLPVAYLLGSIPFGLIVGKMRGIDVRKAGSGNIGATNVGRLLGGKYFALVFCLDLAKGLLPMLAAGAVLRFQKDLPTSAYLLWLGVGFAAIAGHMFSIFLRFSGGKGVATSAGVVLGLFPYFTLPGLIALIIFAAAAALWRMVSLASIIAAVSFALGYVGLALSAGWPLFGRQLPLLVFSFLMAILIVYRHRANIARIRAGTESKIGQRVRPATAPPAPDVASSAPTSSS